jgi:hypothetical protein
VLSSPSFPVNLLGHVSRPYEAIGQKSHAGQMLKGLFENAFEHFVFPLLPKDALSTIRPNEDVIHLSAGGKAICSVNGGSVLTLNWRNYWVLTCSVENLESFAV